MNLSHKYLIDLLRFFLLPAHSTVFLTISSFFGAVYWLFELSCHFHLQYMGAQFLFLILMALSYLLTSGWTLLNDNEKKSWRLSFIMVCVCFLINLCLVAEPFLPAPENKTNGKVFSVLQLNLNSTNRDVNRVVDTVKKTKADFLAFEEVDDWWSQQLLQKLSEYPHHVFHPRPDNFGIAMFSRLPVENVKIEEIGATKLPSITGRLQAAGKWISFVITHPVPPLGMEYAGLRNEQMEALAEYVSRTKETSILVGDLNVTPWSPYFARLLKNSGLHDSRSSYGLQPSWPVQLPLLYIPIDHVIISSDLAVCTRQTLPAVGSDHLPVYVELGFKH